MQRGLSVPSVHDRLLFCSAKDVFGEFHQEEALAFGVEDVCQTLTFVLEEVADTGVRHKVEVFIVAHVLTVFEADTLLDSPVFVADEEALPVVLLIIAVVEYELMQFGEPGIAVDEDFQHKVVFLLAE